MRTTTTYRERSRQLTRNRIPSPPSILNPHRRVITPRPRPAPQRAAPATPNARPAQPAGPTQAERAWLVAQRVARFLWANRREPNLWLGLLVSGEVVAL